MEDEIEEDEEEDEEVNEEGDESGSVGRKGADSEESRLRRPPILAVMTDPSERRADVDNLQGFPLSPAAE